MRLNERCVAEFSTSSAPTDKEGFLNKKGEVNRGYQRRWFILKGNLLYYFEKRSDKEPIGVIVLDNCHVELAESGEPYAFQITFGGDGSRTYILGADSPKEMEAWMRAITHSNYECLKMMVESFESTLEKLTSEENDLASASSSTNVSSVANVSGASNFIGVDDKRDNSDTGELVIERPVSEDAREFSIGSSDSMDSKYLQTARDVDSAIAFNSDVSSDVTITRTEPMIGNLITLDDDDDDDDQIPIQTEFSLDEGFYSFSKHTTDIMPLSYSDLGRLEDMHTEDLLNRLSGNLPSRSRDDSDLTRVKRDVVPRNMRPKSERRRNNVRTVYESTEASRLDRGKSKTMPRSSSEQDVVGFHSEHSSVFRYLHELYSASIWVKCKEFGKNAALTPL